MNRNVESRFALNPTNIDISRSTFDRSCSHKTTFNVGDIIPFYVDEVLPGDTFKVSTSKVVRMQTLLTPMMDNLYLDTYYFFVPNRLVWEHWKQFMGESNRAWLPNVTYTVPQIIPPISDGFAIGGIADYFGIPTGITGLYLNALPFRAYALICNEWFRDENTQDPLSIPVSDSQVTGVNSGNTVTDVAKGGKPFKAAKYHDYFTSCLPAPQKGPDIGIPVDGGDPWPVLGQTNLADFGRRSDNKPVMFEPKSYSTTDGIEYLYDEDGGAFWTDTPADFNVMKARNLWAIPYSGITLGSINALRMAFQVQKAYEKDARSGTRYVEIIKGHFGVTSPDARQQRPEYLGGNRVPININQVVQNSETGTTPQGTVSGFSVTSDKNHDFIKSFTEHGFVIGVMVARYDHTYQQGIERFWSRKTRWDYYWPVTANVGEQAVKNKELFAQGSALVNPSTGVAYDEEVFGYNEAWSDYRYKPNRVSGEMRSSATKSLDCWHLADEYSSLPHLSSSWMDEDKSNVDRVLAVNSSVSNQLFADIYVKNICTRPMPLYSIPGLIDHH